MSCHAFVDFDGTLVPADALDSLLERFGAPAWREIDALWQAGQIGSREALTRQVDLIRATPEELDAAVDEIEIDPGFLGFMQLCADYGITASVVSDGLDRVIGRILHNHGIVMNYTANRLEPVGADRWKVSFPNARADCRMLAGHCKCATAALGSRVIKVVIGDGRSDLCVAEGADLVLAKGSLVELCARKGIANTAIGDFGDVTERMGAWLRARRIAPRRISQWHAVGAARGAAVTAMSRAMPTES
jgi:2,3-diketo-5-methylthio-1-phosphopentane phosphatase